MPMTRVRMNTAAAFQLTDAKGQPAGFSSAAKGDEIELSDNDARSFARAGYATILDAKNHK